MDLNPKRPVMFTCATQVSVIQVGADEREPSRQHEYPLDYYSKHTVKKSKSEKETVPSKVVKNVSAGLTFDEEVVKLLAPYSISYNEKSIFDAFDTAEFLSKAEKTMALPPGRFNMYGPDKRHMSCYFKKTAPHKLKPIKQPINLKRIGTSQSEEVDERKVNKPGIDDFKKTSSESDIPNIFITETDANIKENQDTNIQMERSDADGQSKAEKASTDEKYRWDEYLLSILSKPTAQWIVTQKTAPDHNRYQPLHDFMVQKYGHPQSTELVRDDVADYDDKPQSPPSSAAAPRRPNTQSSRLLNPVHAVKSLELDTVPYSDENAASFYRKPGGIKNVIKIRQKEMGALNLTATSIAVKKQELPPPPKLRDFVNPKITEKTVYETSNNFQRDWLTGNKQVHQICGETNEIVIENHNKYTKVLQPTYPKDSSQWMSESKPQKQNDTVIHKVFKGNRRWHGLPKPVEDADTMILSAIEDLQETMNPNSDKFKPSEALSKIVDEWRAKWHLNMRFDDATPEDLIKDMEDIHPHIRIKAVSTCAKAILYKPPPVPGIQITSSQQSKKSILPEKIFVALECLLEDEHPKVRLAAAITLHALDRPNDKAEEILRINIQPEQNKADRWAAVQCLGLYGYTDSDIIGECVSQMLNTEDMILYEKACALLAHISKNTGLVHSMIAEHLNDCSWRNRVMALKCFPKLYGGLNTDVQNKMVYIMWNDTHSDVRKTAAQSLGKCGYARLVHDKMAKILEDGNQSERAETLSKIGFLGIMTSKLMIPFMKSFRDEYVSIRREACIAAGNLRITEEFLISELLRLANRDPIWRIKALAMQALGKIGVSTPDISQALLWALRFEEEEGVRAEACHSIIALRLKDQAVLDVLQNRMLVESSPLVQRELAVALELNGTNAAEDMDMVAQIKSEVRKLSNRTDIFRSICQLEDEETLKENTERMIYIPPPSTNKLRDTVGSVLYEDDQLVVDQVPLEEGTEAKVSEHNAASRQSSASRLTSALITETIPEMDEDVLGLDGEGDDDDNDDDYDEIVVKSSGALRNRSRVASRVGSSLKSQLLEDEIQSSTDVSVKPEQEEEYALTDSNRRSSGLGKKRLSESRAVTITPTVLSISLEQIQVLTQTKEISNQDDDSLTGDGPKQKCQSYEAGADNSEMRRNTSAGKTVPLDPVEATRRLSTNFLYEKYSDVIINSPISETSYS